MSDWQPIETAPKDGTHVLLLDRYEKYPVSGSYSVRAGGWLIDHECLAVSCGQFCYGGTVTEEIGFDPIYWMPLPEPPK